ncbi:14862_t:CDS:1, partial [Dentiscutata heterogama]
NNNTDTETDNGSTKSSSKEVLNYIEHILGFNAQTKSSQSNEPVPSQSRFNIINISSLNA